jgi:hypothetical protein
METAQMLAGLTRPLAIEERERLKETFGSGVVDWGNRRRPAARYEAYWRGMPVGLFPSPEAAGGVLKTLG